MAAERSLAIEVVCALPDRQIVCALTVSPGTTAREAIVLARVQQRCGDVDVAGAHVGIFGRVVPGDTVLCDGDRVEIYRPLVADPKQARRRRAARRR